jgi:hypothetical protein
MWSKLYERGVCVACRFEISNSRCGNQERRWAGPKSEKKTAIGLGTKIVLERGMGLVAMPRAGDGNVGDAREPELVGGEDAGGIEAGGNDGAAGGDVNGQGVDVDARVRLVLVGFGDHASEELPVKASAPEFFLCVTVKNPVSREVVYPRRNVRGMMPRLTAPAVGNPVPIVNQDQADEVGVEEMREGFQEAWILGEEGIDVPAISGDPFAAVGRRKRGGGAVAVLKHEGRGAESRGESLELPRSHRACVVCGSFSY